MTSKLRFTDPSRSPFFATLRQRVDAYFRENQLSKHANRAMWAKLSFFLLLFLVLYGLIISNQFGPWTMLLLAIGLGTSCSFIGFNVCHDALHGSLSRNARVNHAIGLLFNVLGANPYVWGISHNVVHHTYTNIPGHDEDLEIAPGLVRVTDEEEVNSFHRYQHYYAFALYGLASLSWVFRKDYVKFFQSKIGETCTKNHPSIEYFNLFFFKGLYYILFIVLPLAVLSITWWQFLIGFVVMHLAEGLVLGLVFQLAHLVEETHLPEPNADGNIEEAWAVHQMRTTANFAPTNPMADFLCGGLNRQIEHHLFPRICHIHYPALSKIVKATAQEYGIPYVEKPSFGAALQSHYRVLRKYGKEEYARQQQQAVLV
jgi:linoleoyl-CoA desaturase